MKLKKLDDSEKAWDYIFIFNAGISLVSGTFFNVGSWFWYQIET